MTEMDRFLAGLLTEKEEYKREEVLKLMGEKSGSYSMYRDRLIKRGILNTRQGYISLALPYFGEYIKEYCQNLKMSELYKLQKLFNYCTLTCGDVYFE